MKRKLIWVVLAFALAAGIGGGVVMATPANGLQTTTLAKATMGPLSLRGYSLAANHAGIWAASINTLGVSDLYVVDNKIPAGGDTGWHSHPGPSLIFVVAGTVTNYMNTMNCMPMTFTAGQSFVDPGGNVVHIIRNETSAPAETIAVQFIPTGIGRRSDEPEPSDCHI
jgi:quercetin dioxygenase-like cupin family protein